ncbi:hypothetical protein [Bacillus sp. BP-3]|uniref:hypothetical protein n=1 Tax=Bacillus sp. BP-3 TaxID=3022773 RepID=UPI00232F4919|nr:hypothetical protein [Bacillus sp. BP-3]MDC2864001.1 hypothetical protein [Bacillus sp. BP-3]
MKNECVEENPLQRFHDSMSHLFAISATYDDLPSDLIREIYALIDNYYLESLSILRSSVKTEKRILSEIESKLEESRKRLQKLAELKKEMDESNLEYANYTQATHVANREFQFRQIELEGEMSSLAALVMLLSLLESTLFRLTRTLIEANSSLPKMHDVMNRSDNGIVKYLKYFEKYIETQEQSFIVGTKKYELLKFWLKVRNNIVHSNNVASEEILKDSKKLRIDISIDGFTKKFRFKHDDVMALGGLCGEILDDCIEKGLYYYFKVEEVIAENNV